MSAPEGDGVPPDNVGLGGHLKSNGDRGWLVLGRGTNDLLLLELGWTARGGAATRDNHDSSALRGSLQAARSAAAPTLPWLAVPLPARLQGCGDERAKEWPRVPRS
jgi:hypothetical protein